MIIIRHTMKSSLRLGLLLLASTLFATAAPQPGGGRKALEIAVSADRSSVRIEVPEGLASVILQKSRGKGGWTRVAVRKAVAGKMRLDLPAGDAATRWRAIGILGKPAPSRAKFPASFYRGENRFGAVKSAKPGKLRANRIDGSGFAADQSDPVEADIWKVDGSTVYFFNQSRGLQVLDISNPADPRITASLRMPATGQDLYQLPGSGPDRTLVLLTQGWSGKSGDWTGIRTIRVSGGSATVTSDQRVAGYLADSRIVGDRLILATSEWHQPADETANWTATTRLSEWRVSESTAPQAAGETLLEGDSPVISAGADWLAVAVHPADRWSVSEVSVFALRPAGLVRMAPAFRTAGSVGDKSAMQWAGNVLTTISEKSTKANEWAPVAILENFRAWSPDVVHIALFESRLGRLKLADGESLFATRFAGDKAYIVTYRQKDPLFVVDLSDPAKPEIAGKIEVDGWSTHLEPLGDLLFAIGWEANAPVASLFDVANPAAPKLLRRVALGAAGTYSEALWDEKALKLLPDAGLAMIPLSTYDEKSGTNSSVVRLLDVDVAARDLRLRGTIPHEFDARRADLSGNSVVSISQRVLVTADVTDRSAPALLAEVSLSWPVDRVLEAGNHLLQIEDGGSGRATVRVSPAGATEQILAEIDLGKGVVRAAGLQSGTLAILRESAPSSIIFLRGGATAGSGNEGTNRLTLDLYDASALPALTFLGRTGTTIPAGGHISLDRLLWPQPNRPATIVEFGWSFWPFDDVLPVGKSVSIRYPWQGENSKKAPQLVLFDIADPARPQVGDNVSLGADGTGFTGTAEAADGLIAIGTTVSGGGLESTQSVRVLAVDAAGSPTVRPAIDLPGELFGVTALDRDGFLAWTRKSADNNANTLQASACDGFDAYAVAGMDAPANAAVTAGGRRLYLATKDGVERHRLTAAGAFTLEDTLDTGWRADSLRWIDGLVAGARWNALFVAADADGVVTRWKFPTWNPGVDRIVPASGGSVLVPFGEYGVERLEK